MIPIKLGRNLDTGRPLYIDRRTFDVHYHLLGNTGAGKTTAIQCLLFSLLRDARRPVCLFVVDRMGGLTRSLQRWIASDRYCPEHVRRRYICIEPACEDWVVPFNPLLFTTEANEYYQVERAIDAVLRSWESQDIAMMPRLRRWCFNAFLAAARLGYPIACCRYLLQAGSDEHKGFLRQLPLDLQYEWSEILNARGQEALRILDSTRNRLSLYFDSSILRRTFGSTRNLFNVEQFINNRNIVLVNVSPGDNQLSGHLGKSYGSLVFNQILSTVRSMAARGCPAVDTYVVLDEFQDYISPDIYDSIPIVRQLGVKLILSNQSYSQLKKGDLDLSDIIFQARSRLMFASDGEDADRLAHEVATLTFDPNRIKHQLESQKQRIAGYRKEWLKGHSQGSTSSQTSSQQHSFSNSRSEALTQAPGETGLVYRDTRSNSFGHGGTTGQSFGGSATQSESESLIPIHEDLTEVSSVTFQSFDEWRTIRAGEIRKLTTGQALVKLVNDPNVYRVAVDQPTIPNSSRTDDAVAALAERNHQSELFVSASEIDREAEELRLRLLMPPKISAGASGDTKPVVIENEDQDDQASAARTQSPFEDD